MSQILFVGGIHGVGKTTVTTAVAEQLGVRHATASALIRGQRQADSTEKAVANLQGNQDILVRAVHQTVRSPTILDGHFCLLTIENEVADVPLATFCALQPIALAVVCSDVDLIVRRLESRDKRHYDRGLLDAFQTRERQRAHEIAKSLERPLLELDSNDSAKLLNFSERLIWHRRDTSNHKE